MASKNSDIFKIFFPFYSLPKTFVYFQITFKFIKYASFKKYKLSINSMHIFDNFLIKLITSY